MGAEVLGIFSGARYGSVMADIAQASMRPNFELNFSLLQNQVITRLNKEIEKANESTEKIDAFLLIEQQRLNRTLEGMDEFIVQTSRNHNLLADVADKFGELNEEVAAIQKAKAAVKDGDPPYVVDPAKIDELLPELNALLPGLTNVDGSATGVVFDDGTQSVKNGGLVRYKDADGASQMATKYSDFGSWEDFTGALVDATKRLGSVQERTALKIETVTKMQSKIGKRLTTMALDIETAKTASKAEKAEAVSKLKEEYSQMLNALSLGFEGAAAQSEYFAKKLLAPSEVEKGSVMNLFT